MNAKPKLPQMRNPDGRILLASIYTEVEMHAYGIQCFEAGRQQGVAQADALHGLAESSREIEARPQWQPIETAPRDGTRFLGYRRGEMATSYLIPRDDCEMWAFGSESGSFECWPEVRPTHWMPLPEPPKA